MAEYKCLSCGDLGIDCNFETRGATFEEVMKACAEHATQAHGVKSFGPELYTKMRSKVRTVTE